MAVGESEARGACRGALVAGGDRPAPTEPAGETSPSLHFRHVMVETASPPDLLPGFLTRLHPFPTAATLSSTQNAPGFACFGLFRVRFAVFVLFGPAKFAAPFLFTVPICLID